MPFKTFITYGFGIKLDDIVTTGEKIMKLASLDKETSEELTQYLAECYPDGFLVENLTVEDFEDIEGDYGESSFEYVLRKVMNSLEGIDFVFAQSFEGHKYLLFTESYPWFYKGREKDLTEEAVKEMFVKYVSILTDEPFEIDYYEAENGC